MSLLESVIGSHSDRVLRRIRPQVKKIVSLRDNMMQLSDEELSLKTKEFRSRLSSGESLDIILPEAFAVVREAARRVLGLEPYEVQLIGGILLYYGRIAEMKTGEGKTLVAALPSYLMALSGKGVHVVTVNDYLAKRDADEIGQIHRFLGLTVGCVLSDMKPFLRKEAYACDITYVTSHELGFDYLRDNMAEDLSSCVQRGLEYCIIDEVDSILIDEARTPLIISGAIGEAEPLYKMADHAVRTLKKGESSGELTKLDIVIGNEQIETGDFIVNEKDKEVHLTTDGVRKMEKFFGIDNFADPKHVDLQHHVNAALRAHHLMFRDKDYVVKDGMVFIVDEFTGRIMEGRRYSDGLHQAIEAKEGLEVKEESKTFATITLQNFFNKYKKKSGMTGTALTEKDEFRDIYGMDVVSVPTNVPMIRNDLDDVVYLTKEAKYRAVVKEIVSLYERRQPVLVGTVSIQVSEHLSKMLERAGVPHRVLNAKYHEMEAEIVSHAGEAGAVTIATNMAGRGTDIKLNEEARDAGGLFIIGTERHESRRIDNQLRGRSGRQGDPGVSRFYLSLEDDVLRLFGSEKMLSIFRTLGMAEDDVIEDKRLSKTIVRAQEKIEANNFAIRKNLMDFDMVNNEQRELIYKQRASILAGDDVSDMVKTMISGVVDTLIDEYCTHLYLSDDSIIELQSRFDKIFEMPGSGIFTEFNNPDYMYDSLYDEAILRYQQKEEELSSDVMRDVERVVFLRAIDACWKQHLEALEQLRQSISLIGYGQRDPVVEYRKNAYDLFGLMLEEIRMNAVKTLFHMHILEEPKEEVAEDGFVTEEIDRAEAV